MIATLTLALAGPLTHGELGNRLEYYLPHPSECFVLQVRRQEAPPPLRDLSGRLLRCRGTE